MHEGKAVIAVVDDDPSVRKALTRLIHAAGYDADAYESAEAFLERPHDDRPSCLILDVHLPGLSGLELQERLTEMFDAIPIVFISAFADESVQSRAFDTGALDFLPKPLDNERLLDAIQRALEDY